jgi:hypothetical protein
MGGNLMRTVTFADPKLVRLMNDSVVAVWNNQNPTAAFNFQVAAARQPKPTAQQIDAYPAGGGGGNMRAYFCTPEGRVIHFVQGYWPAKQMAEEVRFALARFEAVRDMSTDALKPALMKQIDTAIVEIAREQAKLVRTQPAEFTKPVRLSSVRRHHAALGLRVTSYQAAKGVYGQDIKAVLTMLMRQNLMLGVIK